MVNLFIFWSFPENSEFYYFFFFSIPRSWYICFFLKVTEQQENLEEAHKHMQEAMKQFKIFDETPDADSSTVADLYLDPLHLNLEMPDMSRLEKPAKPPVPQVIYDEA